MKLVEIRGPLDRPKDVKELEDEDHSILDGHGIRHGLAYISNETHAVTLCKERIPLRYDKDQVEDAKLRLTWSCLACLAQRGADDTIATTAILGHLGSNPCGEVPIGPVYTVGLGPKAFVDGCATMMATLPSQTVITVQPKGPR